MKQKVSLICKLFVAVMTPAAWLIGAVHPDPNALLVVHGLGNLKSSPFCPISLMA